MAREEHSIQHINYMHGEKTITGGIGYSSPEVGNNLPPTSSEAITHA